jgi:hypothetical protein
LQWIQEKFHGRPVALIPFCNSKAKRTLDEDWMQISNNEHVLDVLHTKRSSLQ